MSERADDDVRGEQRKAARQLKQQQLQRGEASTAMATGAERRSLPSPENMLGQPWSSWVDAVKLHGSDDSEESLKECGKNREAMRLCREDMAIFGQCPAQDDFYLVQCSHCSQLVKPQAFQAHYERRHSSSSKPSSSLAPSATYTMSTPPHKSRGSSGGGGVSSGVAGRPSMGNSTSSSSSSSSSNSKTNKSAKEISGHGRPPFFPKVPHDKILTPTAVKVEKVKVEPSANKMGHAPSSSSSSSSSSSATVSSPMKPGLSCPSIPKPPTLAPGQIPNGKGHLSLPDKKQDHSASSKRPQYKRPLQEREFNPDIHCGVVDLPARKPCTRSLTCKTHSLSQRRAVPGRGKRFDTLLAEHKSKAREKELQHRSDLPQQTPPLRDPHPPPSSRLLQDPHQVSHGNGTTADAAKPSLLSKSKPHNPGLPRLNSSNSHSGGSAQGDPGASHEPPHHPAAAIDGQTRLSSDEGEAEEREDAPEKLDCHYSGYHPRPAAYCTFGSRLYGRSCHSFDRRWDRVRCAFSVMMDKHVNSQMWKKIPLALENSSAHRTSTNSLSSSASAAPRSVSPLHSGFRSPSPAPPAPPPPAYGQSHDSSSGGGSGKPALSYGTTLNARSATAQGSTEHPAYGTQSRQVSSSPQMPSPHHPSLASGRPLKQPRTSGSSKSFRPKESPSASLAHSTTNTASSTNSSSGGSSVTLGKKRKNSSLHMSSYATEASPSSSSSASSSSSSSPFKRNCVLGSLGSTGSSVHALPASSNPSSTTTSSSSSSSHTGVYTVGLNCTPGRTSGLSLRHEPLARGPPSASPAESIKRMSVVMNSSDSKLSLGPFVHQGGDGGGGGQQQQHGSFGHPDARLEGKKRKGSPATGPINSSSGGLSGGQGPGRPKVAKSPSVNNIHSKHARTIPGTPGLSNNSLIHQPKARP